MAAFEAEYLLSTEEKVLCKIIFPSKTIKSSNTCELVIIRNLIWAVFFFSRLRFKNLYVAEHLLSFLSFFDLARLCSAARVLGHHGIWEFISRRITQKKLEIIFLFNDPTEPIETFQRCQTLPLDIGSLKAELNLDQVFICMDKFIKLSKSLNPYSKSIKENALLNSLKFAYDDYPCKTNSGNKFNPVFELVTMVCTSTVKIFSYAGKSRDCIGQIIYVYRKNVDEEIVNCDWSPDGKTLLIFTELRRCKRTIKVHCFRYQPSAGTIRKLQFSKSILIDYYISSFSIWCDSSSILALEPGTGRIVKFTFESKNLVSSELVDCFERRFEGTEKLSRHWREGGLTNTTLFGCFSCCHTQPNICAIVKHCEFSKQHRHDVVVILDIKKNSINPLWYLSVPGTLLSLKFWSPDAEVWLFWKENSAEIWDSLTEVECSTPPTSEAASTRCPLFNKPPWLSSYSSWETDSPAKVACGHFSLCDSKFRKLTSFEKHPGRTERLSMIEYYTFTDRGAYFYRKMMAISMSERMQVTATFIGLLLKESIPTSTVPITIPLRVIMIMIIIIVVVVEAFFFLSSFYTNKFKKTFFFIFTFLLQCFKHLPAVEDLSNCFDTLTKFELKILFHPENGIFGVLHQVSNRYLHALDIYAGEDVDYDLWNKLKQAKTGYNKPIKLNLRLI